MSKQPVKLTAEEIAIITMMRRYSYQEIVIQIQDSVIISVNQIIKYRRKKGGGLVFGKANFQGLKPGATIKISTDEGAVITKLRDKFFQQITIAINQGGVEAINQTLKFRKKNSGYSI